VGSDFSKVHFYEFLQFFFVDALHCCSSSGELKVKLEESANVFQVNLHTDGEGIHTWRTHIIHCLG